ncbi:MAG: hypothetical protein ACR2N1_12215 [Rubripirellula sp.]
MRIKDRFRQEVKMSVLQRQSMIIVTMLSTLFLVSIWPRFLADALSVNWAVYVVLIVVAAAPLFMRNASFENPEA